MNTLYYGDNLPILRQHIPDDSIDLIYLDPPFNSNRSYNVLFKESSGHDSDAQITAFNDTWEWGPTTAETLLELPEHAPHQVVKIMSALVDGLGHNDVTAYLVMMTARLVELHRVLKPTGSLYLHYDPTASHYLKVVMDAIFDPRNFRNEIIWKRTSAHSGAQRYGPVHDVLLFYSKGDSFTWNPQYGRYDEAYLASHYRSSGEDGRAYTLSDLTAAGVRKGSSGETWRGFAPTLKGNHWKFTISNLERLDAEGRIHWPNSGGWPRYKRYLDEVKGVSLQDIWTDVSPINAQAAERLGYPTQKPLSLLERIIQSSSNPGDVVLDPFCGCGTAIHAAQKLGRSWVGIDVTHLAIALIKYRMESAFPGIEYQVIGEPCDTAAAHQLAEDDRYQFEWWALSLAKARPYHDKKKGADTGIDGLIYFNDDPKTTTPKTIIVQVKSGGVGVNVIQQLAHVVDREKAAMGLLITLEDPTRPMEAEAIGTGLYVAPTGVKYPKIQILTVTHLLQGEQPKYPYGTGVTFRQAQKEQIAGETLPLF